jgi:hypothetical protein
MIDAIDALNINGPPRTYLLSSRSFIKSIGHDERAIITESSELVLTPPSTAAAPVTLIIIGKEGHDEYK